MHKDIDTQVKERFLSKPPLWRIEAVIHDGAWYTIKKWAKQAKVTEAEVEDYIKRTPFIIQGQTLDSYRVGKEAILKWYKEQNLDLKERLVPKNYPPKIWAGMTESEAFEKAPRRLATYLLVEIIDSNTVNKMRKIFEGKGSVATFPANKCKIYGLSGAYLKEELQKAVPEKEFKKYKVRIQTQLLRELGDFPQEFVDKFTEFYLEFAKILLKRHQETIRLYLPDKHDQEAQIYEWVWRALKKYDNTKCVPFSGYLTTVLSRWPYDLPNNELGKDLACFQRQRKLAKTAYLEEGYLPGEITEDMIAKKMDILFRDYLAILEQHELWKGSRNAKEYIFEETGNERKGANIWVQERPNRDYQLLHQLSLAAIRTALKTKHFSEAEKLIRGIDTGEINYSALPESFIVVYRKELEELLNEG